MATCWLEFNKPGKNHKSTMPSESIMTEGSEIVSVVFGGNRCRRWCSISCWFPVHRGPNCARAFVYCRTDQSIFPGRSYSLGARYLLFVLTLILECLFDQFDPIIHFLQEISWKIGHFHIQGGAFCQFNRQQLLHVESCNFCTMDPIWHGKWVVIKNLTPLTGPFYY